MKCGEAELAADVYGQLRQEGFALERPVFQTVLEVFLKLGRWDDALGVIADMHAQVGGVWQCCSARTHAGAVRHAPWPRHSGQQYLSTVVLWGTLPTLGSKQASPPSWSADAFLSSWKMLGRPWLSFLLKE